MKILVINCGSSSLKYQLIDMNTQVAVAGGLVERVGIDNTMLTHNRGAEKFVIDLVKQKELGILITDHKSAVALVIDLLLSVGMGIIKSVDEVAAVGHRIVHGGDKYSKSVIITEEVVEEIAKCAKLAPLHNPAHVIGIRACQEIMPNKLMVAVFDTAFHQTMPEKAYTYSLPYELCKEYKIRRYGFHGTSHKYVSLQAAKLLNTDITKLKLITCHLGNGASIAAVQYGKSVDTSMGFTPLAGLTMGTRCGDIDPSVIEYLEQEVNLSPSELDIILNKKSGVLGISGLSSDFRDIEIAAGQGNARAQLALDVFRYNVIKYIGGYVAAMNGVDAIIFTAGVGENDIDTRADIIEGLSYLGADIDPVRNKVRGILSVISSDDAKIKVLLVPTNEELMISQETLALI